MHSHAASPTNGGNSDLQTGASDTDYFLANYSFTVPSSSIAGEKTYPPGDYKIRYSSLTSPTWEMFNDSKSMSGDFIAEPAHAPLRPADVKAQFVFYKYGDSTRSNVAGHKKL